GGLGVFESVIVLMLSARLPANQIFGALLGYRVLYYWLPLGSLHVIGIVMLGLVAAYGATTRTTRKSFTIRTWEFQLPSTPLAVSQLILAALDWMLASLVLFVLLAPGRAVSYPQFLAVYLLAQLAGLASQVPGGLGVFESVIVLMLSARLPANQIFGALLGYRVLYYWLPLAGCRWPQPHFCSVRRRSCANGNG
ncbi:MAG: hypothetical protein P8X90_24520, partial [Desulfobacterales bacterium]